MNGRVVAGYIQGATVFFDANSNGVLDPEEPSIFTDETGSYNLIIPTYLALTDGAHNGAGRAFTSSPVDVSRFSTAFTFRTRPGSGTNDGITFTLEGAARSPTTWPSISICSTTRANRATPRASPSAAFPWRRPPI